MSEETKRALRVILGLSMTTAVGFLEDEGMDQAMEALLRAAPSLADKLLDSLINESVVLDLGPDATASGTVEFG